jgi:membrane protease YdiL (CAAX protease family)
LNAPPDSEVRPRRWSIHLALIGAFPIFIGIAGWGRNYALHEPALTHGTRGLLITCAVELLIFSVVFGLAWLASRATRDDLLLRWRNGFWTVPIGIGYSVAVRILLAILMGVLGGILILTHLTTPQQLQDFVTANRPDVEALVDISALRGNPVYFWLTITLVSFVIGGLREELWRAAFLAGLRNVWPQPFGSRAGQFAAVAIAAVLFGLGHLAQGVLAVCLTGLLGLALGVIMVLHRSIWPAVIAHGMFDATSLALLPWVSEHLPKLQ